VYWVPEKLFEMWSNVAARQGYSGLPLTDIHKTNVWGLLIGRLLHMYSKKKQSLYRHGQSLRAHQGAKVVNRPPLLPRKYPWYSFLSEAESTPAPEGLS